MSDKPGLWAVSGGVGEPEGLSWRLAWVTLSTLSTPVATVLSMSY